MSEELRFRGRSITQEDIEKIREIILLYPQGSRSFISQEVCRLWNWRQPNGKLKDMICRSLLLSLESNGFIELPPRKRNPFNPLVNRSKPVFVEIDETPIETSLESLRPIVIKQVRRTSSEKLANSLVERFHYLRYTQPVGEHLKYIAYSGSRPLAVLFWSSAPWYIGTRDKFIGWRSQIRQKHLNLITNNTRFLILPWVKVPNLGSHLLAQSCSIVFNDFLMIYNHPLYLFETFVDTERFVGTCYKAANWIYLGLTTGRGKLSKSHKPTRSKKAVFVYPLRKDFREYLNGSNS